MEMTSVNPSVAALFTPFTIRSLVLKNRIVMAPMTRNRSPRGVPGADVAAYYRRRAEGETGLIITEGTGVDHPAALGSSEVPVMAGEEALAGWRRVVDEVHAAGGAIVPQLWHQGVLRRDGTGPYPDAKSLRPTGIWGPIDGRTSMDPKDAERVATTTEPMTDEDIEDVVTAFARSARAAQDIGFDGIAVHGAHGYLLDTFLWGYTNRRTDRYGADAAGRTRVVVEILRAIRREVGDAFPLIFRFSQWKLQDYSAQIARTPRELEALLVPIADAGADVFDASSRYFERPEFEGSPLNLAGWAKTLTGLPSITVGSVGLTKAMHEMTSEMTSANNLDLLMERFERGEFDLVGVGRALLNDAAWPRRARLGEPFKPFDPTSLHDLV